MACQRILISYPDYGKASAEYIVGMTDLLRTYDEALLVEMSDPKRGIQMVCPQFLPTTGQISALAKEILDRRAEQQRYDEIRKRRSMSMDEYHSRRTGQKPRICPFPKLWEAFENDPDIDLRQPFDRLFEASRRLATEGRESAANVLRETSQPQRRSV